MNSTPMSQKFGYKTWQTAELIIRPITNGHWVEFLSIWQSLSSTPCLLKMSKMLILFYFKTLKLALWCGKMSLDTTTRTSTDILLKSAIVPTSCIFFWYKYSFKGITKDSQDLICEIYKSKLFTVFKLSAQTECKHMSGNHILDMVLWCYTSLQLASHLLGHFLAVLALHRNSGLQFGVSSIHVCGCVEKGALCIEVGVSLTPSRQLFKKFNF